MANNTTLTCTAYSGPIRSSHDGSPVIVPFRKSSVAVKFGTLGDTVLLAKIPTGALIVDAFVQTSSPATAGVANLVIWNGDGTSGTTTLITSLSSGAAGAFKHLDLGYTANYRVSMSDDNAIRYATLALRSCETGSETVSLEVAGYVMYLTSGNKGAG